MPKSVKLQNVNSHEKSNTKCSSSSEHIDEVPKKKRRKRKERERTPEYYQPITEQLPRDFDLFNGLTGQFCDQNQTIGNVPNLSSELAADAAISVGDASEFNRQTSSNLERQENASFVNKLGKGRKNDLSQNVRPNENWEFVQPEIDRVKDEPPEEESKSNQKAVKLSWDKSRSQPLWDVASPPPPLSPQISDDVFSLQLEDDDVSLRLILPPSSTDLLIENELLMTALEAALALHECIQAYEVLRRFHQLLRLTPFTFEDLCVALQLAEENTQLLAEIHMALMRVIIKSEESFGFTFTPADCKSTFDFIIHYIDEATWPVIVSDYIMSLESPLHHLEETENVETCVRPDSAIETAQKAVTMPQYPFVNAAYRLVVLKVLVDIFVDLEIVRNEINSDGQITYDTKCRRCGDPGNLLCCDNCDAVYHLQCIRPPLESIPDSQWLCPLCDVNQLPGVSEATLSEEADDCVSVLSPRNDCLGYDRHLRRYWFISRRLIVEKGEFVRYYSQREQVNYIIESLDALCLEKALHARLMQLQSVFTKQMAVTMELTQNMEDQLANQGISEDMEVKMVFTEDLMAFEEFVKNQENLRNKQGDGSVVLEEFYALNDSDELFDSGQFDSETLNCIQVNYNCDKYEKAPTVLQQRKSAQLYCLGMDYSVKQYKNFFNNHILSMNSTQLKEIEEKKRHLNYKFCLDPELKWQCSMVGGVNEMISGLRQAIEQIEEQVPPLFMHKEWFEKYPNGTDSIFKSDAPKVKDLVFALTSLQQHFKPCLFLAVWKEACCNLGFWVKYFQTRKDTESASSANNNSSQVSKENLGDLVNASCASAMQSETAMFMSECITDEYYQKIYEADLEKPVFVSVPLKHNLYKTRGELYRQVGHGWVWVKKKKRPKTNATRNRVNSKLAKGTTNKSRNKIFQLNSSQELSSLRNNVTIDSKTDTADSKLSDNECMTTSTNNSLELSTKPVIDVQSLFQQRENENFQLKRNTQLKHLLDVRLRQAAENGHFDISEAEKLEKQITDLHRKILIVDEEISCINLKIRKLQDQREICNLDEETALLSPLCYSCSKNVNTDVSSGSMQCYSPLCIENRRVADEESKSKNPSPTEQKLAANDKLNFEDKILSKDNVLESLRDQKSKLELDLEKAQVSLDGVTATSFVHKLSLNDADESVIKNQSAFEDMTKRSSQNIFSLPKFQLKTLAQSGLATISEVSPSLFPHKLSTNSILWPFFCERPSTKQVWEQTLECGKALRSEDQIESGDKNQNEALNLLCTDEENDVSENRTTGLSLVLNDVMLPCALSSIAVMLRLLHASMRWEDLKEIEKTNVPKNVAVNFLDKGFAYRIQLEPGTAIIKDPQNVRDVAPLNLETEFLMRIVHLTDDRGGSAIVENSMKDVAISPTKRPGKVRRSGRTPKFKQSLLNSCSNGRSVDVHWVSETDLELWEVKHLLERRSLIVRKYEQEQLRKEQLERQKAIKKARQLELEARAKELSKVKPVDKAEKEFGVWSDSDEETTNERSGRSSDTVTSNLITGFAASGTSHGQMTKTSNPSQPQLQGVRRVVVVKCSDGTSKQLVINNPIGTSSSITNQVITSGQSVQPDGTSRPIRIIPIKASSILSQNPQAVTVTSSQSSSSPKSFRVISSQQLGLEPNHTTCNSQQQWFSERSGFGVDSTPKRTSATTIPGSNQDIARNIVSQYINQNGSYKDQPVMKNTIPKSNTKVRKFPKQRLRLSPKKTYRDLNSKAQVCMNLRSESERLKYEELTRKLTFKCQQLAKRAYKTQIERKRNLMREQIDLELMFKKIKVPLSRKIYELPYTAVIQNQLLPENDNDPNISFSSSSESENDQSTNIDDDLVTPGVKEEILISDEEKMWKSNLKFSVSETGVLRSQQTDNNAAQLLSTGKKDQDNLTKSSITESKKISAVKKEIKSEKRKSSEQNSEKAKRFQNENDNLQPKTVNKIHQSRKEVFDHISSIAVKQEPEIAMADYSYKNKQQNSKKENEQKVSIKSEPTENSILQKGSQLRFGDTETLHCICKTIYDYKKFYLKCELCLNWFHGKCVGINQKQAKRLTEFICPNCSENSNKDELYCICKTPYDENQFYIGCDACGNWFHGSCVGINSDEASKIETYFCPNCKTEEKKEDDSANFNFALEAEHFELLGELMRVLMEHQHSWPFNEESTDKEYPNYSKFVSDPICFRNISDKLSSRAYSTFSEFNADINRVFSNARKYHWKDSSEFQCCDIVEKELVTFLTSFRQSIQADDSGEDEETEDDNDDQNYDDDNDDSSSGA